MSDSEAAIVAEILKADNDLRMFAKDWVIVHIDLFSKPTIWKQVKILLGTTSDESEKKLLRNRSALKQLDKDVAYYYFEKIPYLTKSRSANILNSIQRKYFDQLFRLSSCLYGVISVLNTINDCLIIEKEHKNSAAVRNILNDSFNAYKEKDIIIQKNIQEGVFSVSTPDLENRMKLASYIKLYEQNCAEHKNSQSLINETQKFFIESLK